MTHNDVLRRLRFALDIDDGQMVKLFALAGPAPEVGGVAGMMRPLDDEQAVACTDAQLRQFLDGLILDRRGPPKAGTPARPAGGELTNNEILKKLRIAMTLMEADLLAILIEVGQPMSKGELTALFRKPDHKHFRRAGDQVLRKFLRGLTWRLRPETRGAEEVEG